jgi:hypothetical protein
MTEHVGSVALERAINAYLHATGQDGGGNDVPTGWMLVVEQAVMDRDEGAIVIATSDGLSLPRQLGILDYAHTMARFAVRPE